MNILFICTGNSCRSPMAEYIARDVFKRAGVKAEFASAGVSVLMSMPASGHAAAICKEYGFEMSGFKTRQVTAADIEWADLILTMTNRHKAYMELNMEKATNKLYTFGEYLGEPDMEIQDPFGGDIEVYRSCADTLEQALIRLTRKLSCNNKKKIAIGCDHAGFQLKSQIMDYLRDGGFEYKDFGTYSEESTDYPVYAEKVCKAVISGEYQQGVLICGTGIGISMAANRHKGIRCALCHDVYSAKATREHNDANILAMGGRIIGIGHAEEILKAFLETKFSEGENHVRRIGLLDL